MFAAIYIPEFHIQANLPNADRVKTWRQRAVAVVEETGSISRVFAVNRQARQRGVSTGMSAAEARACKDILLLPRSGSKEDAAQAALLEIAYEFSPCIESTRHGLVTLDMAGMKHFFNPPGQGARQIVSRAAEKGFHVNVGMGRTPDVAAYAARGFPNITIVPPGHELRILGPLPADLLPLTEEMKTIFIAWGIRTFKDVAVLPSHAIVARLGQEGLQLQKLARGTHRRMLMLYRLETDFIECFEFESPIETVEALRFVVEQLLEKLCRRVESNFLAIRELKITLLLAVRQIAGKHDGTTYEHTWKLPEAGTDAFLLAKLIYLHLERCPQSAPIREVRIAARPGVRTEVQQHLFSGASFHPQKMELTLADLQRLAGDQDNDQRLRVGSPVVSNSHRPGSFDVRPFAPEQSDPAELNPCKAVVALRRSAPQIISVEMPAGRPRYLVLNGRRMRVLDAAGPWQTSGKWWNKKEAWIRQDWHLAVSHASQVEKYSVHFDRIAKQWVLDGRFD